MLQRNLLKLILSFTLVVWAVFQLIPIEDRPFAEYARSEASAKPADFDRLVQEAADRTVASPKESPSVFVALRQIANERRIDLATEFFPDLNLGDTKNLERKNALVLDHLLKESRARLQLGLDLRGGVAFTLEVADAAANPAAGADPERNEKLDKAIEIIGNRINKLGVAEPVIRPIGNSRIEVQLANVSTRDNPEIQDAVKKPARLDFRMVHPQIQPSVVPPSSVPVGYEVLTNDQENRENGEISTLYYVVKRVPEMTGEGIETAVPRMDQYGNFEIHLSFNSKGAERFGAVTGAHVGQLLGVVLDGKLYSAPRINEAITGGQCQITGSFTQREAETIASALDNPLDLPLVVKEQYEVGPSLAEDAISSGKLAFIISTALTVGFILIFYTIGGVIAAVGMAINVLVILGMMAQIGATLTLPGIAGIVLTLAMSVDSNILIFERMREETNAGKSLAVALESGFDKAWSAILDSNVTTLITALIMYWLGTGPVKGFGITLAIGIFTTMFSAVVVSKLLLEFTVHGGVIKRIPMFSVLQNTNFDFMGKARPAFIFSWAVVLIGVGIVAWKGKDIYGIDFSGGDQVVLAFQQRVEPAALSAATAGSGLENVTFVYQRQLGSGVEVLRATTEFESGESLVKLLQEKFPAAGFLSEGVTRIGPSVGEEIQWNALIALVCALGGILLYVAFRFEIGYGIGAILATIHDLLMTVGIFVMLGREFNASMVAAVLLVAGYSINDTIVVFDRIREELKLNPGASLLSVVNRSLNLTLSRTIITGGTTFLSALTLIIVTSGEVNDIALTLFLGVITGTFSSLFIASPIFFWYHKGDRGHVEKHEDVKPVYEWTGSSKASR